ncbi:MAG TPA: hypothetical protein PKI11_05090 [Candidatus Hydrogenedentes bacterium]|nr:hypothetical protein [Candidatus Hydrogenedentota bacterium]HNT87018.1 hypothetical protein [Candidatus Hydrogenedentota bacterium]
MSTNIIVGLALLVGLVAYQIISRQVQFRRLKHAWEEGHEALRTERFEAAESAFRRCVRVMPTWPNGRAMLAVALTRRGKVDEAEEQWKMAAALEPKRAEGHLALALFYAGCVPPKAPEAAAAIAKALECDPQLREQLQNDPRLADLRGMVKG